MYSFIANQHGTAWYHSHFSAQYGDGLLGAIVINGPATANYDIDLGPLTITDFYYGSANQASYLALTRGPPTAGNGLINGTMMSPDGTAGAYNKITIEKGKKYRLRLINTALDNHFMVSLDSHKFTVIAADFVPIVPYNTSWLFIGIGQRYDVIITASEAVNNYWFRAEVQQGCGQNANNGNIRSIFSYEGAPHSNPTSTTTNYTQSCADETGLVPYTRKDVPQDQFTSAQAKQLLVGGPNRIPINNSTNSTSAVFSWNINGSAINIDWEQPTLQYIFDDNTSYPSELNIIKLPDAKVVSML